MSFCVFVQAHLFFDSLHLDIVWWWWDVVGRFSSLIQRYFLSLALLLLFHFCFFISYSSSAFIDAIVLNACSSVALKTVDSCFDWWSVIDHHIFPDSQRFSKWFFSEYKLTELWSHCKLFCSRYCAWSHIRCTRNRTWVKWKIDVLVFCSSFVRFASGRVCVCEYV